LSTGEGEPPRAGFVVGRKVGKAVVRNRVRRRLREQVRARLANLEPGTLILVRALPDAAAASSADLGQALDVAMRRLDSPGARARARSRGSG
jgi:ribonuclease P protein component